jgi:hypothetical protein
MVYVVAPLGILVNLIMMLFLPPITWLRLVIWLGIGLLIYFCYGYWQSTLGQQMRGLIPAGLPSVDGQGPKSHPAEKEAIKAHDPRLQKE